jgi:hypothetical protein
MMREKTTPGCLGWMRERELGTPGLVPDWLARERDTVPGWLVSPGRKACSFLIPQLNHIH